MSGEAYDPDGDISRYLQTPSLESHVLALPADGEPAAAHVGPPQHVPPVQGGVALPMAPTPLNLPMDDNGAMPMDMQPLLDDLQGLSLHDHYSMDDGDYSVDALFKSAEDAASNKGSSAMPEHSVFPGVEEGITFVPLVLGELDCSKCRSVREVLHESANHKLYFIVHVADPAGTFQHAIADLAYIDASGQTILNELMFADLRKCTLGCVQNFIAKSVEKLKNDTTGKLTDSCSTSQENNDMLHTQLEMDMLKEILSAPSSNTEAVGVPQSGPQAPQQTVVTRAEVNTNAADTKLSADNWPMFSPAILESSQVSVRDGKASSSVASATGYESQLAKQRRRMSQLTMKDIAKFMHMSKKDAANKLNISVTSLKRLCRKNKSDRWPARKINSLNNEIKKLEQAAVRNVGTRGLFAIQEKIGTLKDKKAQVYASVWKIIQENQKHSDSAGGSNGS